MSVRQALLGVGASGALLAAAVLSAAGASGAAGGPGPLPPASAPATAAAAAAAPLLYDDWFTGDAMRVDLFHTASGSENGYSLDEVVWEPRWPGTRRYLLDPFDYGTHRYRVVDVATGRPIFSRGYATLLDEWDSTPEARAGVRRSMSESVRFPWPRRPVLVHVDRRGKDGSMREVFAVAVDPASHHVSRARPFGSFRVVELGGGPPPERALDVLVVPEGYAESDRDKLAADLARFARVMLDHEPWRSNRDRIQVRAVEAWSRESGATEPRKGIFRDTILGTSFNTFDSERYLTVTHTKRLRQIGSLAPYDTLYVMVNSARYGGGGVYNQWSVFVSDNEYDDYVFLHEYGHHMGGLADEYYDSAVSSDEDSMYPPGVEPWEPNITALLGGRREAAKWHALIAPATPVPTPEGGARDGEIGAFEGAGYKAKGLYRPQKDCKMFHKGLVGFCAVCTRSLEAMLHYYTGEKIER